MFRSLYLSGLVLIAAVAGAVASAGSSAEVRLVRRAEAGKLAARQFAGYSSSSTSSSSFLQETSFSSVPGLIGGYNGLIQLIQATQTMFSGGGISFNIAMQQIAQVAARFQTVFSGFQGCQVCYSSTGLPSLTGVFGRVFGEFQSLVGVTQQLFPNQWPSLFSTYFGGMGSVFTNFFSTVHSGGISFNSFLPSGLTQIFSQVGLSSTSSYLSQFGF